MHKLGQIWDFLCLMSNSLCLLISYETVNKEIVNTLTINNVDEQDSALYLCEVMVGINDKVTEQVEVKVRTPVRLEDSSTRELTVVEGGEASLDCAASGFPAPAVVWTRADGAIMNNGKRSFSGSSLRSAEVLMFFSNYSL